MRSGSERAALRRPHRALLDHAIVHDPAVQVRPDQPDGPGVSDPFLKAVDEDVVIDPVKRLLDRLPTTALIISTTIPIR